MLNTKKECSNNNSLIPKSKVVLVCLFGMISCQVDKFMTSPDVDTKSGFFPDSGFIKNTNAQVLMAQDPQIVGTWGDNPADINNENKVLSAPETLPLKNKHLQQILSRMPEEKAIRLEQKQRTLPSQPEDTSYLHLFIGTKDSKG